MENHIRSNGDQRYKAYPITYPLVTSKGKAIPMEKIRDMYFNQDMSTWKIEEKVGVSHTTIGRRLRDLGLIEMKRQSRKANSKCYIKVQYPSHPRATSQGQVLEHILVWEKAHGKYLPQGWNVHHLNGIKNDNRPSNLLGLPSKAHLAFIPELKKKIRELEIENEQLRRILDGAQPILKIEEN